MHTSPTMLCSCILQIAFRRPRGDRLGGKVAEYTVFRCLTSFWNSVVRSLEYFMISGWHTEGTLSSLICPTFRTNTSTFFCSGVEPSVQVTDAVVHSSKKHSVPKHRCCTVLSCLLLRGLIMESLYFPLAAVFLAKLRCNIHLRSNQCCLRQERLPSISKSLHLFL